MKAEDAQLALSVWVRLLKAHRLMLREVRRCVPGSLTLPQFDVLAQLRRSERGMTPGMLTEALLVTAGNVTGIVDRLLSLVVVERQPVPDDRRTVLVRLTARGRRLMDRAIPRHRRDVGTLLAPLPAKELRQLRDLLGAFTERLEERA